MFDEQFLRDKIRNVSDYPKKGVNFKDITPLLKDSNAFRIATEELALCLNEREIDYIIGIDARGFIIGAALAYVMQKGFIPIRKKGKLPSEVLKKEYKLEYGTEIMEIHKDALKSGDNVIIVDDVLATGGTAKCAADLVTELGANLNTLVFLAEISFLKGREMLSGYEIISLIRY